MEERIQNLENENERLRKSLQHLKLRTFLAHRKTQLQRNINRNLKQYQAILELELGGDKDGKH